MRKLAIFPATEAIMSNICCLSTCARCGITHAAIQLTRAMSKRGDDNIAAAKRVLSSLKDKPHPSVKNFSKNFSLHRFSDPSRNGNPNTVLSPSVSLIAIMNRFLLGGGPISKIPKKQPGSIIVRIRVYCMIRTRTVPRSRRCSR